MGGSSSKETSKSRCTCRDDPTSYDSDDSQQVSSRNSGGAEVGESSGSVASSISEDTHRDEEYDDDGGSQDERDNNGGSGSTNYWQQHEHLALSFGHTLTIESPPSPSPMNHHIPDHFFPPYPFFSFASNSNEDGLHSDISRTPHLGRMDVFWQPEPIPSSAVLQYWSHQGLGNITNIPICDVCNQLVPMDSRGRLQLEEDPIWQQKYCTKHLHDGTAKCFTCRRLEPIGTNFSSQRDHRKICIDCKASEITNFEKCSPLIWEIEKFYEYLDMKVYQDIIPINLIYMNHFKEKDPNAPENTLGCTRSNKPHHLHAIIETPRFGPDNTVIGVNKEPFKLVSYREVKEIDLLIGQPRLCTGQTLAHEMMHAWLALEGYKYTGIHNEALGFVGQIDTLKIEEGFCQVMAHMWLDAQLQRIVRGEYGSSPQLEFEKKLAQHLIHNIRTRNDEVYGGGFRLVNSAVLKYGLRGTLDFIKMTGSFPG